MHVDRRRASPVTDSEHTAVTDPNSVSDLASQLSPRQQAMLRLLGNGLSLSESAAELEISRSTANSHRARLMERLKLNNREEVIAFAKEWMASGETGNDSATEDSGHGMSVPASYDSEGMGDIYVDRHSPSARFAALPQ